MAPKRHTYRQRETNTKQNAVFQCSSLPYDSSSSSARSNSGLGLNLFYYACFSLSGPLKGMRWRPKSHNNVLYPLQWLLPLRYMYAGDCNLLAHSLVDWFFFFRKIWEIVLLILLSPRLPAYTSAPVLAYLPVWLVRPRDYLLRCSCCCSGRCSLLAY